MNQTCITDWDKQYIETLLAPKVALVVDDDPEARQGARDAAEDFFLTVEEAADEMSAIVRALKPPLDYIFLDVRLPSVFHAVSVIHKISEMKVAARVIIMSSDSSQFKALEDHYDLGLLSFFRKGVDVKATFAKIYDQLGIRRKGRPPTAVA